MYYICTRINKITGSWCNGNTTVFGAVILSSSLGKSTNKIYRSLKVEVESYNKTKKQYKEVNPLYVLKLSFLPCR